MISHISRCLIAAMVTALPAAAQQDAAKAQENTFHRVPLIRTDGSGHYLAPVTVGQRKFKFVVDSGAGMEVVLSKGTAKALGKKLNEAEGGGAAGGSITMHKTRVGRFIIGDAPREGKGLEAYVVELQHAALILDGKKFTPDGLIGARMLEKWDVVVATGEKELIIPADGQPGESFAARFDDSAAVKVPFDSGMHNMPFVDVVIEGETYSFLIDTGAGIGSIEPAIAEKLGLEVVKENSSFGGAGDKTVNNAKVVVANGATLGGKARFPKMYFHTHSMAGTLKAPQGKKLGGILGGKVLASGGAYVDFGSHQVIIPKRIAIKLPPKN